MCKKYRIIHQYNAVALTIIKLTTVRFSYTQIIIDFLIFVKLLQPYCNDYIKKDIDFV